MYLGADGAVKVWNTRSGKLIHTFEGHLAGISTISWSPDGATIASGSDDKTIRLWNVLTVVPCVYLCLFDQTNVFFSIDRAKLTLFPLLATTTTSTKLPFPQRATC